MSRELQQAMRVFTAIQRMTRGRLGLPGTVAVCLAVVLFMWWSGTDFKPGQGTAPQSAERPVSTERSTVGDLDGVLTDVGRGVFESPAGLRYTRGSRQGHRIDHVMTHSRDIPDRVGQHGVFDADDTASVIGLVDEAYEQAEQGRRVHTRRDDGRTVYTVDLGRRVGYVGGQSGARRGNPPASHVRLILEDNRVITAYPVIP